MIRDRMLFIYAARIRFAMGAAPLGWEHCLNPAIERLAMDLTDEGLMRAVSEGCPSAPLAPALAESLRRRMAKRGKGRPSNTRRDALIRSAVRDLAKRRRMSIERAVAELAERIPLSEDSIARIAKSRNKSELLTVKPPA